MPRRSPTSSRLLFRRSRRAAHWSGFLFPPLAALILGLLLLIGLNTLKADRQPPASDDPSGRGGLAAFFTPTIDYWHTSIQTWAQAFNLDPNLIATVMQIESCGDPRAVSPAGAGGLFQVMPFHFIDGEDPYNPDTNAGRGLAYLRLALDETSEDVYLALAGYNGGLGVTGVDEAEWPAETRRYSAWGAAIYQEATQALDESPTLDSWLTAGGWRLCAQAALRLGLQGD